MFQNCLNFQNGPKKTSKSIHNFQNILFWSNTIQNGQKWSKKKGLNSPKWSKILPKWSNMVQKYLKLFHKMTAVGNWVTSVRNNLKL